MENLLENLNTLAYQYIVDNNGSLCLSFVSDGSRVLTGYKPNELIGDGYSFAEKIIHIDDQDKYKDEMSGFHTPQTTVSHEYRIVTKSGDIKWVWDQAKGIYSSSASLLRVEGYMVNVTDRIRLSRKQQDLLEDKDILISELKHHLKNNMAVATMFLELQMQFVKHPDDAALFRECQNRFRVIALTYNQTNPSKTMSSVDFNTILQNIGDLFVSSYEDVDKEINFNLETNDISMGVKTAVTCGLLLNELLSIVFKNAFEHQKIANVKVLVNKVNNGQILMRIIDDKGGFPNETDWRNSKTMGVTLVNIFLEQLKGEMQIEKNTGTTINITF